MHTKAANSKSRTNKPDSDKRKRTEANRSAEPKSGAKTRPKMASRPKANPKTKTNKGLHPRNQHNQGYDFPALIQASGPLAAHVRPTSYGEASIDFGDPAAVKALNAALLKHSYGILEWDIPAGFLCPPIPGRVDYLHYAADLLAQGGKPPKGQKIRVLDIGTGANGVYPLLGIASYGWQFVASDIDEIALANVARIATANPKIQPRLELRLQREKQAIFEGIIGMDERFDLTICNPPFHASQAEASAGTQRKLANLRHNRGESRPQESKAVLNFGGRQAELWCEGGERRFLQQMLQESAGFGSQCLWFSSLVSKADNLKPCYRLLAKLGAKEVQTMEMHQGNKITRVLAWSFLSEPQRQLWGKLRR
ncbi:23S rRNA (adenine(1618)-N(6))-methyltransferase RlmF [Shewanella sp. AS16]|uniref:23S rRNA (adenine(1618)-N(6))-methyltransferase RlmF n=1 Tax=Shewanella sp. AS16 TaxID=2907625 RepID=UPI003FA3C637